MLGLDDTLERRRGAKISAKGIYRDPVRSSHSHFVKSSGLRWLCLMLLAPIPWAKRVWALPFLTVLAPSERFQQASTPQRQEPKKLTDWARQMLWQVRRWLPQREIVVVADSSFAALELLAAWQQPAAYAPLTAITRLRLDAALYEPAPPRLPGQKGAPRKKGARLPTLQQRLHDPQTKWHTVPVEHWYGRTSRTSRTSRCGVHACGSSSCERGARSSVCRDIADPCCTRDRWPGHCTRGTSGRRRGRGRAAATALMAAA